MIASISAFPLLAPQDYVLGVPEMFTLFFIVLGPLKLLGAFAQQARALGAPEVRTLALRAALVGSLSVVGGGLAGSALLAKWNVEPQVLACCLGLIFFAVAFKMVMQQYAAPAAAAGPEPPPPPSVLRIVFPHIAPPYGMAAVIVLLALSETRQRTLLICALVLATMLLDYLAMLFARRIMRGLGLAIMQVLGAVLGVLQVALAVQIVVDALRGLGFLAAGR